MNVTTDPIVDWSQRIWIGRLDQGACLCRIAGVEPAPSVPRDGGELYVTGSWVPRKTAASLTPSETARLKSRSVDNPLMIGLFRVPNAVLRSITARAEMIWRDEGSFWLEGEGVALLRGILEGLGLVSTGPVRGLGPNKRPSGLHTTTYDQRHGLRIGLHIDSWDGCALENRIGTRNRLCINLGQEMHYLYVLPLPVAEILTRLVRTVPGTIEPQQVAATFFNHFPETTLLRLGLPPGFAYVAPTDAIIHDGGSAPSIGADVILTWLGQFVLQAPSAQDREADRRRPESGAGT